MFGVTYIHHTHTQYRGRKKGYIYGILSERIHLYPSITCRFTRWHFNAPTRYIFFSYSVFCRVVTGSWEQFRTHQVNRRATHNIKDVWIIFNDWYAISVTARQRRWMFLKSEKSLAHALEVCMAYIFFSVVIVHVLDGSKHISISTPRIRLCATFFCANESPAYYYSDLSISKTTSWNYGNINACTTCAFYCRNH